MAETIRTWISVVTFRRAPQAPLELGVAMGDEPCLPAQIVVDRNYRVVEDLALQIEGYEQLRATASLRGGA